MHIRSNARSKVLKNNKVPRYNLFKHGQLITMTCVCHRDDSKFS